MMGVIKQICMRLWVEMLGTLVLFKFIVHRVSAEEFCHFVIGILPFNYGAIIIRYSRSSSFCIPTIIAWPYTEYEKCRSQLCTQIKVSLSISVSTLVHLIYPMRFSSTLPQRYVSCFLGGQSPGRACLLHYLHSLH